MTRHLKDDILALFDDIDILEEAIDRIGTYGQRDENGNVVSTYKKLIEDIKSMIDEEGIY